MKSIKLTLAILLLSTLAFGQGNDRTNAIMAFKAFNNALQESNIDKASKELLEAKKYIDLAYVATPTEHKTLFYRGQIYGYMPLTLIDVSSAAEMVKDPCAGKPKYKVGLDTKKTDEEINGYREISMSALKEAMKNPTKKDDFTGDIKFAMGMQSVIVFNCGSKFYNDKKYAEAAEAFLESVKMKDVIGQVDTLGIYNTALCYERTKNYEGAATMWGKCAEIKYAGADAYSGQANAYSSLGKEAESLKAVKAGRAVYPKDLGLIISEVNYYLGKGDNASAEKAINEAIALDNKNPTLYFALGSVYDNLANPKTYLAIGMTREAIEKLIGAPTKSEKITLENIEYDNVFYKNRRVTYDNGKAKAITGEKEVELKKPDNYADLMAKGENSYKKAIELDGNYFDALFNLGAMKYNEGASLMNKINDITDDALFTAEKAKADDMFKQALPYNEKAREVNPKDRDNLMMLKNIYARTGDTVKATEITNLLKN